MRARAAAARMAAVPVAEQQVTDLSEAVTFWERGATSRRPPTDRSSVI